MLCDTCSKLAIINGTRTCVRCKGGIFNNLSVICDSCSKKENMCSICIKKLVDPNLKYRPRVRSNCSGCGK